MLSEPKAQNRVPPMPNELNPIKRVWKPKAPARTKFDIYGNNLPHQDVHEKNTDSIWDTYEPATSRRRDGTASKAASRLGDCASSMNLCAMVWRWLR
jgi:hypothetical protein